MGDICFNYFLGLFCVRVVDICVKFCCCGNYGFVGNFCVKVVFILFCGYCVICVISMEN